MAPNFYIVFVRTGVDSKELTRQPKSLHWTAPKATTPGDVALIYVAGHEQMRLRAVVRALEHAKPGVPLRRWTKSKKGFFAQWGQVTLLKRPLLLHEIRARFPLWKRWTALRGVRCNIVPVPYRHDLASWVVRENPRARALLKPFLNSVATVSNDEAEAALVATAVERERYAKGQGFASTAELNQAKDKHAMELARAHFKAAKYKVKVKGKPYDLECLRGRERLFVEVKGTSTIGEQLLLTPNEVRFAREHRTQMALFIVAGMVVNKAGKIPTMSGGTERLISPWSPKDQHLTPVGFSYAVPGTSPERGTREPRTDALTPRGTRE